MMSVVIAACGIAARTFRQTFNLAEHVKVTGASLENGLLTVALKREVPEALKPRRIAISRSAPSTIEAGATVEAVVCAIDRSPNPGDALSDVDLTTRYLLTRADLDRAHA